MDNNQNDDYLGEYKKDFEEMQGYCILMKKIEENIELIYKNLNNNNTQANFQKTYLIDKKDYNKFKEQIEYDTFINDMQGYKDKVVTKLVMQDSENKNELKEKLKQTIVNSIQELYKLLKKGNEYFLINVESNQNLIEKNDEGIYSYCINSDELILSINEVKLQFAHNKNIINLKVLKTNENEILKNINNGQIGNTISNINQDLNNNINETSLNNKDNNNIFNNNDNLEDYKNLTDWLEQYFIAEKEFKNSLISKEKNKGYLIEYTSYIKWERDLKLNSLRDIFFRYLNDQKRQLTEEEKTQIIDTLKEKKISKKNNIQCLKFKTIEELNDSNKINNFILLNKKLFDLINGDKNNLNSDDEIEYKLENKIIELYLNNEKSKFYRFENIIFSYLTYNIILLKQIYNCKTTTFNEKKATIIYMFNKKFFESYVDCFQYNNLLNYFNNNTKEENEIFNSIQNIPGNLINSIKVNMKSFKIDLDLMSPILTKIDNSIDFLYINFSENIFIKGNLLLNFTILHRISKQVSGILKKAFKLFFIKEKILIIFENNKQTYGQIGNVKILNEEIEFVIDYLISVKQNKTNEESFIVLGEVLKKVEYCNDLYEKIYKQKQNYYFELQLSDKLILKVLNYGKKKEYILLKEKNQFIENNEKQIEPKIIENNNNIQNFQNINDNNNNNNNQSLETIINQNNTDNPFYSEQQQINGNNDINLNNNNLNLNEHTKVVLKSKKNIDMNNSIVIETNEGNNMNFNQNSGNRLNDNINNNNQNNINNNNINNNIYNIHNINIFNNVNQIPNNNFNYPNPNQNQAMQQAYDIYKIQKYLALIVSFFKSDHMIKMKMSRNNNDAWNYKENLYLVNYKWILNVFLALFNTNEVSNIFYTNPDILLNNDNNIIMNIVFGMISDNLKQYLNNLDQNSLYGNLFNNNNFMVIEQQSFYNGYKRMFYNFYFLSEEFLNELGNFFNTDIKGQFFQIECILNNQKIFAFTNDNAIYYGNLENNFSFNIEKIIYYLYYETKNEIINMFQTNGISCFNFILFSGEIIMQNNPKIQVLNINQNSIKNNFIIQKLKGFIYFDSFNKKLIQDTNNINNMNQEDIVIIKKDLFNKIGYGEAMKIVNKYIQILGLNIITDQKQMLPNIIANMQTEDVEFLKKILSQNDFIQINKNDILLEPKIMTSTDNKSISFFDDFIVVKKDVIKIFMDKEHISDKYVKKIISGNNINIIVINNDKEKTLLIGNIINKENSFKLLHILNFKHSYDLEIALEKLKTETNKYIFQSIMSGYEEYLVIPMFDRKDMISGYFYQCNESILYEPLNEYYLCENLKNIIQLFNYYTFLNNKLQNWKGNKNKIYLSSNEYCLVNKKWVQRFKNTFKYENFSSEINAGRETQNIIDYNDKDNFLFTDKNIYTTLKSFNVNTLIKYNKEFKEIKLESDVDYILGMENITYIDGMLNQNMVQLVGFYKDFEILPKNIINKYIDDFNQVGNFTDCIIIDSFISINFPSDNNGKFITLFCSLDGVSNSLEIKSVLIYYSKEQLKQILQENKLHDLVELKDKRFFIEDNENYAQCCSFKYVPNSMKFNNGMDDFNINNDNNNNNYDFNIDFNNDGNNNANDGIIKVDILEYNLVYQVAYPFIKNNFAQPPLKGLDNIGATCYMNATLQCFSNIEPFVNFFKYNQFLINKVRNEITYNTKYTLSSSFKLLIEKLWPNDYMNNPKKSYSPYEFKAKISVMNPLFKGVAANDSKDLLNFIIMTLHEELNETQNKIVDTSFNLDQRNMQLIYNSFIQNFQANNNSEISRLFYAYNFNMTECQNCFTRSYNFQTYFFLIFPLEEIRKYKLSLNQMNNFNNIIENNTVNIYDCLDYERKENLMDGTNMMYCNYCRVTCNSKMSTHLCTGPEILIIILNRGKGKQFDVKINFDEQLNLSNYIYMKNTGCFYNLIGVITHIGQNGMGGHFIAYCKNPIFNTWNKYNDSIVSPVNNFKSDVIDFAMPYLLFYQKYHP